MHSKTIPQIKPTYYFLMASRQNQRLTDHCFSVRYIPNELTFHFKGLKLRHGDQAKWMFVLFLEFSTHYTRASGLTVNKEEKSLRKKLKFIKLKNLKLVLLSNKNIHKVHHQCKEFQYQFVLQIFPNNASNINPVWMSGMGTNIAGGLFLFSLYGQSSFKSYCNCC